MKNACFILFFFVSISSTAQNAWDLFPLHQKTWWRAGDTLRLYYNDSVEIFGDTRFYSFGSKYVAAVFDDCFWGLLGETDPGIPFFPPPDFFYTWESKQDDWNIPGLGIPVFYPKSLPGESWTFPVSGGNGYDQIRVMCVEMDSLAFWGKQVWAKKFRLMPLSAGVPVDNILSDFEMILTENYGLSRFIPFHELAKGETGPIYEITGFINDGQNFGWVPSFESFTQNYQEGNLYKWQETREYYYPTAEKTVLWHLDSLTSVMRTMNEVTLSSHRKTTKIYQKKTNGITTIDSSAYTIPEFTRILKKTDFQPLFDAASGWYSPAITNHFGNMAYVSSHFDSTGALQLSGDFNYYFNPCELQGIIDAGYSAFFEDRCGYLGFQEGFLSGYLSERLIGCRQGTDTWGDITPPPTVGVFQPAAVFPLRIFPSLASAEIFIEGLDEQIFKDDLRLEIRHADGRLGLEIDAYHLGQVVDISRLTAGIFILTITSENAVATGMAFKR